MDLITYSNSGFLCQISKKYESFGIEMTKVICHVASTTFFEIGVYVTFRQPTHNKVTFVKCLYQTTKPLQNECLLLTINQ
jgi:hypothetical protein